MIVWLLVIYTHLSAPPIMTMEWKSAWECTRAATAIIADEREPRLLAYCQSRSAAAP